MARTDPVSLSPNGSGSAATVSGLVRIYPTATGVTHALRGVDADFHELGRRIACAYFASDNVRASDRRFVQLTSPWRSVESMTPPIPRMRA